MPTEPTRTCPTTFVHFMQLIHRSVRCNLL